MNLKLERTELRVRNRFFLTDITARLACVLFLSFMGLAAMTAQSTVPGRLVLLEGDWTIGLFVAILAVALAVLVDLIVNSLMPERFQWEWVKSRRDLLYVIGGLLSIAPSYYIAKLHGLTIAGSVLYLGMPVLIFHLAVCDIISKHLGVTVHEAG